MARPTDHAIDTFVSITGVSEAIAAQKLEENGGDLNQAINAHFSEVDIYTNPVQPLASSNSDMHADDDPLNGPRRIHLQSTSDSQHIDSFSLLDSILRKSFFSGIGHSGLSNFGPWVSYQREKGQAPIEFKDGNRGPGSALGPRIEDIIGSEVGGGPEIQGVVTTDDDNDDTPIAPASRSSGASVNESSEQYPGPFISPVIDNGYYNNEIEEEMIRAAIEVSNQEAVHHDDLYHAALLADQEKELKSKQEVEIFHLEENASREAILAKEKLEEEKNHRKQIDEEELEKKLAAKEASLDDEPSLNDENAVTLLVRLPDGGRCQRRFLKSDKLQLVFDYVDTRRIVKPGSYRLVRPYPRRAFTDEESGMSLNELGLSFRQSLFLELIRI